MDTQLKLNILLLRKNYIVRHNIYTKYHFMPFSTPSYHPNKTATLLMVAVVLDEH